MAKHYLTPQPYGIKGSHQHSPSNKPTNLQGSELEKNQKDKEKLAKIREKRLKE